MESIATVELLALGDGPDVHGMPSVGPRWRCCDFESRIGDPEKGMLFFSRIIETVHSFGPLSAEYSFQGLLGVDANNQTQTDIGTDGISIQSALGTLIHRSVSFDRRWNFS